MMHEQINEGTSTPEHYEGMEWKSAHRTGLKAISPTTRSTYLVEQSEGNLWSVRHGFPDAPGKPNTLLAQYADRDVALVAAERHDFRYWRSSSDRVGVKAAFVGSKGVVADFIAAIPEHEREEATDLLVMEHTLKDGRPFSSAASFFEATKSALKQERNGKYSLNLLVDATNIPLWLIESPLGSEMILGAVETGSPDEDEWRERGKSAVRRAAVLPKDNSFQGWMLQRYDRAKLIQTAMAKTTADVEEAVEETLRRFIGCPSRRELFTNRDAIVKLERIDREFYLDLSRGF